MKWIYIIEHKLKAALCLGVVLILVLWNNIGESNKMVKLGESFNTIYDDRLMAENYIFKMSELLHEAKLLLPDDMDNYNTQRYDDQFSQLFVQIKPIITLYDETVLTPKESILFSDLKMNILSLEKEILTENCYSSIGDSDLSQVNTMLENALNNLSAMAEIQVAVGKELREQSEASIKSSVISSQFEVALLVVISLIIQALIFASKSVQAKFQQQSNYN